MDPINRPIVVNVCSILTARNIVQLLIYSTSMLNKLMPFDSQLVEEE